jgi:hypothetical protein
MFKKFLMFTALLTVSVAAVAHHSFAMFDMVKRETIHGRVKTIEWTNPHVWIWVDRQDAAGAVTSYGFELASPGEITRSYGWTKTSLKVGDEVTVEYAPLRSGKNGGALSSIKLPSGNVLFGTAHFVPVPAGTPSADKPKG